MLEELKIEITVLFDTYPGQRRQGHAYIVSEVKTTAGNVKQINK